MTGECWRVTLRGTHTATSLDILSAYGAKAELRISSSGYDATPAELGTGELRTYQPVAGPRPSSGPDWVQELPIKPLNSWTPRDDL